MNNDLSNRISDFLEQGGDFETGLSLLGMVMNNPYFITNLRRKGVGIGYKTVVYELRKRRPATIVPKSQTIWTGLTVGTGRTGEGEKKTDLTIGTGALTSLASTSLPSTSLRDRSGGERQKFVLREQFPFLGADNCPNEFKVLVADMISSHEKYIGAHEELYRVVDKSNEVCFSVAEKVVEHYLNNRIIWDELTHYRDTGQILGLHSIFNQKNRERELEEMEAFELMKLYRNLPRSIHYYEKRIREDRDNEQTIEWKQKQRELTHELKVVKRILQIYDTRGKGKGKAGKATRKG